MSLQSCTPYVPALRCMRKPGQKWAIGRTAKSPQRCTYVHPRLRFQSSYMMPGGPIGKGVQVQTRSRRSTAQSTLLDRAMSPTKGRCQHAERRVCLTAAASPRRCPCLVLMLFSWMEMADDDPNCDTLFAGNGCTQSLQFYHSRDPCSPLIC